VDAVEDLAARFARVEGLLRQSPLPTWAELGSGLGLSDDRWQRHDPAGEVPALAAAWMRPAIDWTGVCALWLGIETDGAVGFLQSTGFAELDEAGFPRRRVWAMEPFVSPSLTAFGQYRREAGDDEGYDYWAPLAWTGLLVRLAGLTPPDTTILAGFAGGDWFTFPPEAGG
jgi:hypothetical protein